MPFMIWDSSLSVGVQEIDRQHQKLVEMLNQFYDKMAAGDKQALPSLLASLAEYTVTHFHTEERYFDRFHYAGAEAHKQHHREFIQKVQDVTSRIQSGKMVMSLEITGFLKEWVTSHIKNEDKKYQSCFNAAGLR